VATTMGVLDDELFMGTAQPNNNASKAADSVSFIAI
jgi:hypothetical protein